MFLLNTSDILNKHSALIRYIKKNNRLFKIPTKTPKLESGLISLIQDIRIEINHAMTPKIFVLPNSWSFAHLFLKASQLLAYRECLGLMNIEKEQYNKNYIEFLANKNNTLISTELENSNPFILLEHIIHLHNILHNTINDLDLQTKEAMVITSAAQYQALLIDLIPVIQQLDTKDVGIFKQYLIAFLSYVLALSFSIPGLSENGRVKETVISKFISETDINIKLLALSLDEDNQDKYLDFYLNGRDLWARTPFSTHDKWQQHIVDLNIFPTLTLMKNFDIARKRNSSTDSHHTHHDDNSVPQSTRNKY